VGWRDTIDAGNLAVRGAFGEPVTYRPTGGSPVSIQCPYSEEYVEVEPSSGAAIVSTKPNILLRLADLGGPEPQDGDVFECRGDSFRVEEARVDGTGSVLIVGRRLPS
jgi:hypothetical protein